LHAKRLQTAEQLSTQPNGRLVRACGLVITRQQPATANGVVFVTLEDETGSVQVIVWKALREKQRQPLLEARLLAVYGVWQRQGEVRHLVAQHLVDLTPLLGGLMTQSRDFR
jgi:error-prone DNA polymerase